MIRALTGGSQGRSERFLARLSGCTGPTEATWYTWTTTRATSWSAAATLRFDLSMSAPAQTGWLDDVLTESLDRERLRAYWRI